MGNKSADNFLLKGVYLQVMNLQRISPSKEILRLWGLGLEA